MFASSSFKARQSALAALILLQGVMLAALFAGVQPHPPAAIAPFGMAPFLAVSISVALAAYRHAETGGKSAAALAVLAAILALVSFGPQKYFDPAFGQVWPAVIGAQIACVIIALNLRPAPTAQAA
ncbi:hypothetical protein [Pseudoprimorskyibacter insulae]|uniref:Uncharacterized protein n=1 Tax=Pseudoprimorskyibacter insulae TaxID=1695997 RepID=A0A2R8AX67_9RHOB|nr:hypothetical protein [Pseudoprimorskyibacter insulae]SPF80613.1 hypothetical protein PRI8871_02423 [Pseudoprimorskyibacter insulae]